MPDSPEVAFEWRGAFTDAELNALHAESFEHPVADIPWGARLDRFSLGWVVARDADDTLVGFVNIVWDGGAHGFVEDTAVAASVRRRGVGRRLIEVATRQAAAAGCHWLHVDFEPHLKQFYLDACGFAPTDAGLKRLR